MTSLIGIYEEIRNHEIYPAMKIQSTNMIEMINLINQSFIVTQIWGLTSHSRLVLLSENNWDSRYHVVIENIGDDGFYFEYLIPDNKSPWKNGTVKGYAPSLQESKKYLAIAMNESEGWKGNSELNTLLETFV